MRSIQNKPVVDEARIDCRKKTSEKVEKDKGAAKAVQKAQKKQENNNTQKKNECEKNYK